MEPLPFWDKSWSVYYKKKTTAIGSEVGGAETQYELNFGAILVPVRRSIINLSIYVMLGFTFIFADKSGIHTGVVTSLFCSSLIFTIFYFYIKFHQKL